MTINWQRLKEWAEAATPGPWDWYAQKNGQRFGHFMLAAPHGGKTVVMDFARAGMHGAEPRFGLCPDGLPRGYRGGVLYGASELMVDGKLNHPDANFIELANPSTVLQMVAEYAAVREVLVELVACKRKDEQMNRMVAPGPNQDALLYELDDFHSRFAMAWADAAALTGGEPCPDP